MSVSKSALTISSVAVALMFGGGVYLYANLGSIAKGFIERAGSETLGVQVRMANLDIQVENRRAIVTNLRIANPSGFSKPHALTVGTISVTLGDLSQELIKIKDISVDETNVYVEVKSDGSNLSKIQSNIKTEPQQSNTEMPKVIVSRFALTDANVQPTVTLIGEQDLGTVSVPPIILTGIGEKENGILVNEAIGQIMGHVLKKVEQAAADAGFYQGMSPEKLKEIGVGQIENVKDGLKDSVSDKIGADVDEVKDKIKGLFE